jgi:hypothetical protein
MPSVPNRMLNRMERADEMPAAKNCRSATVLKVAEYRAAVAGAAVSLARQPLSFRPRLQYVPLKYAIDRLEGPSHVRIGFNPRETISRGTQGTCSPALRPPARTS